MSVTQETYPIIKMTAAADQLAAVRDVNFLHWISKGATEGDDLLVVDDDDNVVWEEVADVVNFSKVHIIKQHINKLKITTMSSGTLYVITKTPFGWSP